MPKAFMLMLCLLVPTDQTERKMHLSSLLSRPGPTFDSNLQKLFTNPIFDQWETVSEIVNKNRHALTPNKPVMDWVNYLLPGITDGRITLSSLQQEAAPDKIEKLSTELSAIVQFFNYGTVLSWGESGVHIQNTKLIRMCNFVNSLYEITKKKELQLQNELEQPQIANLVVVEPEKPDSRTKGDDTRTPKQTDTQGRRRTPSPRCSSYTEAMYGCPD